MIQFRWAKLSFAVVVLSSVLGFASARAQIDCMCQNAGYNQQGPTLSCVYIGPCDDCDGDYCETDNCGGNGCASGYYQYCVNPDYICDQQTTGRFNGYCG